LVDSGAVSPPGTGKGPFGGGSTVPAGISKLALKKVAKVAAYLAPPILLGLGSRAAAMGLGAWLLMAIAFWPRLRFYGRSPLWTLLLPLIAAFYLGATLHSAVRYWEGRGGLWKGRVQDPVRA